jgi:hypothetical protein
MGAGMTYTLTPHIHVVPCDLKQRWEALPQNVRNQIFRAVTNNLEAIPDSMIQNDLRKQRYIQITLLDEELKLVEGKRA